MRRATRMRRSVCPGCGVARWVNLHRLETVLAETGDLPFCRDCRPPEGRPPTKGTGKKQLPCADCGTVRWVEARKAKQKCRACLKKARPKKLVRGRRGRPRKPRRRAILRLLAFPIPDDKENRKYWALVCTCGSRREFYGSPPRKEERTPCPNDKCGAPLNLNPPPLAM